MTPVQHLVLPLLVHVALVAYVGLRMAALRTAALRSGEVSPKRIALDGRAWPERVRKVSNNYDNNFVQPVLWWACVALFVATGLADTVAAVLSWLFVLSRIVHTAIHTGYNYLPHRGIAFGVGVAVSNILWIWLGLRLYVLG